MLLTISGSMLLQLNFMPLFFWHTLQLLQVAPPRVATQLLDAASASKFDCTALTQSGNPRLSSGKFISDVSLKQTSKVIASGAPAKSAVISRLPLIAGVAQNRLSPSSPRQIGSVVEHLASTARLGKIVCKN